VASALRVLGIDPGLTRCGVGVVDVRADRSATLVHVGVVRSGADLADRRTLAVIAAGLRAVLAEHRPDVVAVERVFAQQNRAP
jgi:crossover junction endodeoxyribonuclease RuvC